MDNKNQPTRNYIRLALVIALGVVASILAIYSIGSLPSQPIGSTPLVSIKAHPLGVDAVDWSSMGLIASGSVDRTVHIWNPKTGAQISSLSFDGSIADIAWSPNGSILAIGSNEPSNILRLWNVATRQVSFLQDPGVGDLISSLAWSPDGLRLAVGTRELTPSGRRGEGFVYVYDVSSNTVIQTLLNPEPIDSIGWSPDSMSIAVGYSVANPQPPFRTLRIWSLKEGEPVGEYEDAEAVESVAWSPEGSMLASGGIDGTITVRDSNTKQRITTMQAHSSRIKSLAWSSDGRFLASGSWDAYVRIWDTANFKMLHEFLNPDYVSDIAWSTDSDSLVAACENGQILIWPVR